MPTRDEIQTNAALRELPAVARRQAVAIERIADALERLVPAEQTEAEEELPTGARIPGVGREGE